MPAPQNKLSEDFARAINDWRKKHQLREDEPLLLCLELFQTASVALGRDSTPGIAVVLDFGESLKKLHQDAAAFQRQAGTLTEDCAVTKALHGWSRRVSPA